MNQYGSEQEDGGYSKHEEVVGGDISEIAPLRMNLLKFGEAAMS